MLENNRPFVRNKIIYWSGIKTTAESVFSTILVEGVIWLHIGSIGNHIGRAEASSDEACAKLMPSLF